MNNLNEKWFNKELGCDEKFVKKSTQIDDKTIDDILALQSISIRLQKSLK